MFDPMNPKEDRLSSLAISSMIATQVLIIRRGSPKPVITEYLLGEFLCRFK